MNKPIATLTATLILTGFILFPVTADAYVGPGAGLSLLGALWALVIAIGTALLFIFAWPIRRMRRRKREAREEREAQARAGNAREGRDAESPNGGTAAAAATVDNSGTARPEPAVELDETERSRRQ